MNSKPILTLKNISVNFSHKTSLFDNLSFEIRKNSFNVIMGPTGSGKTTILKLIKGIIPYFINLDVNGTIYLNSQLKSEDTFFRQSLDIAYLFQDFDLQFVGSTVEQELVFSLENLGQPRDIIEQRLQWFTSKIPSLISLLHRGPHTLSGGELAQIVFISTVINDPEIILLDEPLQNLDSQAKKRFLDLLRMWKGKKTIIISSHDIEPFLQLTDTFLLLSKESGSIKEYTSKNSFLQNIHQYPWINLSPLAVKIYLAEL